uniref:Uncharacterized protein n=1 Tax=Oryza sativa subsp. japonica TaxID=39947 RepID=Q6Z7T1_ORYSJ|nr:hypothetical protein [Oryza sativa Japonica Group]
MISLATDEESRNECHERHRPMPCAHASIVAVTFYNQPICKCSTAIIDRSIGKGKKARAFGQNKDQIRIYHDSQCGRPVVGEVIERPHTQEGFMVVTGVMVPFGGEHYRSQHTITNSQCHGVYVSRSPIPLSFQALAAHARAHCCSALCRPRINGETRTYDVTMRGTLTCVRPYAAFMEDWAFGHVWSSKARITWAKFALGQAQETPNPLDRPVPHRRRQRPPSKCHRRRRWPRRCKRTGTGQIAVVQSTNGAAAIASEGRKRAARELRAYVGSVDYSRLQTIVLSDSPTTASFV